METLAIQREASVARVTLNRPDAHNAMSDQMVGELLEFYRSIRDDRGVRVVVLGAAGKTFCAGGDIKDMQAYAGMSMEEKTAHMRVFDAMLTAVNQNPQVTITRVQGAAMGGGFGLVCCSDMVIASAVATFGLPETRLGLSPAMISPYVIARLGLPRARRLMLTGGRLDAEQALAWGLADEVAPADALDARVNAAVNAVLECAPQALAETKALLFFVQDRSLDETLPYRAELISRLRESEEGQEGMLAFIQKRKPQWAQS